MFPGDIVEYPRNKYFSHFAVYYGEKDGVQYVAHLTSRGQSTTSSCVCCYKKSPIMCHWGRTFQSLFNEKATDKVILGKWCTQIRIESNKGRAAGGYNTATPPGLRLISQNIHSWCLEEGSRRRLQRGDTSKDRPELPTQKSNSLLPLWRLLCGQTRGEEAVWVWCFEKWDVPKVLSRSVHH